MENPEVGERRSRRDPAQSLAAKALRSTRSSWAELLRRVFEIEVLTCPYCGARRKLIALLADGRVECGAATLTASVAEMVRTPGAQGVKRKIVPSPSLPP